MSAISGSPEDWSEGVTPKTKPLVDSFLRSNPPSPRLAPGDGKFHRICRGLYRLVPHGHLALWSNTGPPKSLGIHLVPLPCSRTVASLPNLTIAARTMLSQTCFATIALYLKQGQRTVAASSSAATGVNVCFGDSHSRRQRRTGKYTNELPCRYMPNDTGSCSADRMNATPSPAV
jgi:hypothetical protein